MYYTDRINEQGQLGSFTESKEVAISLGWIAVDKQTYAESFVAPATSIAIADTEKCYDGTTYRKGMAPKQPLAEAKAVKLHEINSAYTEKADLAKTNTPNDEVLTWDIQKLEAEAYQTNASNPTPSIDILATSRGMDRVELINKILKKVEAYKQYIFALTGKRQKYEDEIVKATSLEMLAKINWED